MRVKGVVLLVNLLMASVASAGVGLPFGLPPGPEDPLMTKVAPDECLLYLTWAGAGSPDPASTNHTEQLVADEEIQTFITEVEKRLTAGIVQLAEREGEEAAAMAKLAIEWGKRLITRPAAVYVSKADFLEELVVDAGAVVNVGEDAGELQELLDNLLGGDVGGDLQKVEIGGTEFFRGRPGSDGPEMTWGVKGEYFYVGIGEGSVEGMLERAETDPPQWLTDEKAKVSIPRLSTFCYVDARAAAEKLSMLAFLAEGGPGAGDSQVDRIKALVKGLGIDKISHVTCVSGLDDTAYVRRCLVGIDGEPTGLLSLADAQPLAAEDLASIPRDATIAIAARMDFSQVMDHLMALIADVDPGAVEDADRAYDEINDQVGFHIRDDLVASLGDVWTIYHSPGEGGLLTGLAGVVTVKDHEKLSEIHDKLRTMLKAQEIQARRAGMRRVPKLGQTQFADEDIYYWSIPGGVPVLPSWCLTEDKFIVALFPQTIKAYLSRGDDYQSLVTVPEVAKLFENGKGPLKIYYQDTPTLFQYLYPVGQIVSRMVAGELQRDEVDIHVGVIPSGSAIAKHLTPDVIAVVRTDAGIEITAYESCPGSTSVAAAGPLMMGYLALGQRAIAEPLDEVGEAVGMLLFPDKVMEAEAKNNLKWIGLAMHNFHDTYRNLPPAVSTGEDGKPLLSWRVYILPYIEQANLYEQFHLDEPWDSEHNKALIAQMPPLYAAPGSKAGEGKTVYLTVRHKDSAFPGEKAMRFADITDGTSNTAMVVEAGDDSAVTWTKPDDYELDPENPLRGLVGLRKGGFLMLTCDGAVQKVSDKVDKETLNNLFTRNDGNVVDLPGNGRRFDRGFEFEAVPDAGIEHAIPEEAAPSIEKTAPPKTSPADGNGAPAVIPKPEEADDPKPSVEFDFSEPPPIENPFPEPELDLPELEEAIEKE